MFLDTQTLTLTEANFQAEVLDAKKLVLVDCWASWCGFFRPINPACCELAIAFSESIKIGHLDIAKSNNLAIQYKIRVVPTLLIFKHGQVITRLIGSLSQADLAYTLSTLVSSSSARSSQIVYL
jgi:thioredoxin 1